MQIFNEQQSGEAEHNAERRKTPIASTFPAFRIHAFSEQEVEDIDRIGRMKRTQGREKHHIRDMLSGFFLQQPEA